MNVVAMLASCEAEVALWKAERHIAQAALNEAWHEAHACDDINLDQPLAGIIADLQKDRERLYAKLKEIGHAEPVVPLTDIQQSVRDGTFSVCSEDKSICDDCDGSGNAEMGVCLRCNGRGYLLPFQD